MPVQYAVLVGDEKEANHLLEEKIRQEVVAEVQRQKKGWAKQLQANREPGFRLQRGEAALCCTLARCLPAGLRGRRYRRAGGGTTISAAENCKQRSCRRMMKGSVAGTVFPTGA